MICSTTSQLRMNREIKAQRGIRTYPKPHSQKNHAEGTGGQKQDTCLRLPVASTSPTVHSIGGITEADRVQGKNFKVDTEMAQ